MLDMLMMVGDNYEKSFRTIQESILKKFLQTQKEKRELNHVSLQLIGLIILQDI